MTAVSSLPAGRSFVRLAICRALGGRDSDSIQAIAAPRWGSVVADRIERSVDAIMADDFTLPEAREFLGLVKQRSILGQLSGLRMLPFNTRMLVTTSAPTAAWVGEGNDHPVGAIDLDGVTLPPLAASTTILATKEALRAGGAAAESALQADLQRGLTALLDASFIDPAHTGTPGESPASVTAGVVAIPSTGQLRSDLLAALDSFSGDLQTAAIITDPATGLAMAASDMLGSFLTSDVGPRGGSLLGVPVITTPGSPRDTNGAGQIALIDAGGIVAAIDGLFVDVAEHATVALADTSGTTVGLWQKNLVGLRCLVRANWQAARAGAVALVADCRYTAST